MTLKLRNIKLSRMATLAVVVFGLASFGLHSSRTSAGVPGSVIINEIMYNPAGGNQDDEYLELYNTTGSPIDLAGWCFSQGIALQSNTMANTPECFTPGTTISANGYLVIGPSYVRYTSTYGGSIAKWYVGTALSNGGEAVTLVDDTSQVIDTVDYDDAPPWPTSPDAGGPSLELKDPNLDNSNGSNWAASIGAPTPGAQNSWLSTSPPNITAVTDPNDVTDTDTVTITANVTDTDTVDLDYKVMFGADVTIPMLDDGNSGDGAAGDNTYGASIPAQSTGELVRFKVRATGSQGVASSPSNDDSMNYHGYMVQDLSVTSVAPILNWFIDDADYEDMYTNHVYDDVNMPCVIVYGNDVYDGSDIGIRGEISRGYFKKSYRVHLPSGYKINLAGGSDREISEFRLNSDVQTGNVASTLTAWWVVKQSGIPIPDIIPTRLQRNGQFEGLYTYLDKFESEWRQEYGYDDGQLYEDFYEKISGSNSRADIDAWGTELTKDRADPTKRDYILDNNDMPNIINHMAIQANLSSWDHFTATNQMQYKDSAGTNRWSILYWDLSSAFTSGQLVTQLSPYDREYFRDPWARAEQSSIYDQRDLRELYFRRVRTLLDKFYNSNDIIDYYNQQADLYSTEAQMDVAKWPYVENVSGRSTSYNHIEAMNSIKKILGVYLRTDWAVPEAQTDSERQQVYIEEANYDANPANEYIKITNNAATPVDISDWHIEGIDYTLPGGAVVPSGGSIYILKSDVDYRASHSPVLVAGQYSNSMGNGGGQLILRTDSNLEIDTYDY